MRPSHILICAVALAGCFTGPSASRYHPATSPTGLSIRLDLVPNAHQAQVTGELLDVGSGAVLLLSAHSSGASELVRIPVASIRDIRGVQHQIPPAARRPTPEGLEWLRHVSRYPGGVPAGVLPQLLLRLGQDSVHTMGMRHSVPPGATSDAAAEAFLAQARSGVARYGSVNAAIADGYRRLGGDLPSMGEHWVHTGIALQDSVVADRPPILIYARARDGATLAGVAYIRFLAPGAPYPAFPAGVPHAWHDHNGRVDEEVLPLRHLATHSAPAQGLRVAVLHAWIGTHNPAGAWTADNWALPYARLGLRAPATSWPAAARMLSLASGGDQYFHEAAREAGVLSAAEDSAVAAVLAAGREQVTGLLSGHDPMQPLSTPIHSELAAAWPRMWDAIIAAMSAPAAARLRTLRAALD